MKLAQKSYRSLLEKRWNSAVKIQTYIKMHLQRIKFKNLLKATLILQKNFRMWSAQSQLKTLKLERHRLLERSAILIQTHFRSHLARQLLNKMKVFTHLSNIQPRNFVWFIATKRPIYLHFWISFWKLFPFTIDQPNQYFPVDLKEFGTEPTILKFWTSYSDAKYQNLVPKWF